MWKLGDTIGQRVKEFASKTFGNAGDRLTRPALCLLLLQVTATKQCCGLKAGKDPCFSCYAHAMGKPASFLAVFLFLAVPNLAHAQHHDRFGHALVQDSKGWVYVDRENRPILRPYIFDNGPDYFEEGLARFVEHGKIGFHDEALNIVIPAQYDFAFPFRNGTARAGMNCFTRAEGEHSSVFCEKWINISR